METSKVIRPKRASSALRATLAAGFAAILALAGTSCMTSSGAYRGNLSDAMNKARDDNQGSRNVPSTPPKSRDVAPPVNSDRDAPVTGKSKPDSEESEAIPFNGDTFFGVRGGLSPISSIPYGGDGWGDILVGVSGESMDFDVFAGVKALMPADGSSLDLSTRDPLLFFRAGGEMRFVPFSDMEAFAPYFSAGFSAFVMFWQFQNPVYSLGDRIDGDAISGLTLSASAGVYVVRAEHVNVGLFVTPEVSFFNEGTFAGFANNWFAPYGAVSFGAEVFFK